MTLLTILTIAFTLTAAAINLYWTRSLRRREDQLHSRTVRHENELRLQRARGQAEAIDALHRIACDEADTHIADWLLHRRIQLTLHRRDAA